MLTSRYDITDGKDVSAGDVYSLRVAQEQDIPRINDMFFEEYGTSYPYPIRSLPEGAYYLVATHNSTGEIVGFSRAAPVASHPGVCELGGLIVDDPHRKKGIANRMTILRMKWCREQGAKVAISEPVCYRIDCASQRNLLKFGFILLGIQPAKYPDLQYDILQGQPESVLMAACWLDGESGFGTRKFFLPKAYRGIHYTFLPRAIHSRHFQEELSGAIPPVLYKEARKGTGYVGAEFIDVPANWKESADAMDEYMDSGYRFSCFLPGFGTMDDGQHFDYVRMYRFPDRLHGFDFRRVHVAEELTPLWNALAGEHVRRR